MQYLSKLGLNLMKLKVHGEIWSNLPSLGLKNDFLTYKENRGEQLKKKDTNSTKNIIIKKLIQQAPRGWEKGHTPKWHLFSKIHLFFSN